MKKLRNDSPNIELNFWVQSRATSKSSRSIRIDSNKKGTMKIGESVVFNFKVNKDGYITIVDIQPGGDVVILFPNDISPNNKISINTLYSIPSKEDGFEITVSDPVGQDTIVAYFTEKKVDWLDKRKLSGEGFWSVNENEKYNLSRGFKITATKLKRDEWESKVLEIEVVK